MTSPPIPASYSAGTTVLGKSLASMRGMLAECYTLQRIFGAVDKAEALERIYIGCLPRPADPESGYTTAELNLYRPFVIVGVTANVLRSRIETFGGSWSHGQNGAFDVIIERAHPADTQDDVADFEWVELVDAIRYSRDPSKPGLIELHNSGSGYPHLIQVDLAEVWRGDPEEIQQVGDYQAARLRIQWGRL